MNDGGFRTNDDPSFVEFSKVLNETGRLAEHGLTYSYYKWDQWRVTDGRHCCIVGLKTLIGILMSEEPFTDFLNVWECAVDD